MNEDPDSIAFCFSTAVNARTFHLCERGKLDDGRHYSQDCTEMDVSAHPARYQVQTNLLDVPRSLRPCIRCFDGGDPRRGNLI